MPHVHHFRARLVWTGADKGPTTDYRSYSREYEVQMEGKPTITGSAAVPYLGDATLMNPEDMVLAAVSACHMLSYLALCAMAGMVVLEYTDDATCEMTFKDRKMQIVSAQLRPRVKLAEGTDLEAATALHQKASEECFIANSVRFPIDHEPECFV